MKFEEKLEQLVTLRNKYAHRETALPTPGRAKQLWDAIDPFLGAMYNQLSVLKDYHLVQFITQPEPEEEKPGWYHSERYYGLKGYNMHERALTRRETARFYFGTKPPFLRRLYLFKPDYSGNLNIHPFVLFDLGGDLYFEQQQRLEGATFLFNELQENAMEYIPFQGRDPITLQTDDENLSPIAGPIHQYFNSLKIITGGTDRDRLYVLPGFPRRSKVSNFNQIIAFHTEAFAGRNEYFQQVEHLIAGPFRAVWVRGLAGYGKTAFLARLAQMHPNAIHYFISPEKGTANARTFLLHVCQSIINRFRFPDIIPEETAANLEELLEMFKSLLERANERLQEQSGKLLILIDGLDESVRYASSVDEIIQKFLPKKREQIPEKIFFVISSRPEEVDLNAIVDTVIDLKPFTRSEVATILKFYQWDSQASRIAYEKSGGQPLYFRFLIDGIKTNVLRSENCEYLPEGITGFYKKFWIRWERDKTQNKNLEKKRLAGIMQHILGFLAAAREPLSGTDLHELLANLDLNLEQKEIKTALLKENLGRFIIGTRRFSLFHDTLREFVLNATRVTDDNLPFGEARQYHELLAEWCSHASNSGYGDRYLIYHLLHSRRYYELVELLEDDSENSLVKRRLLEDGGSSQLVHDLRYGILAGREIDSLDRIFSFVLMQLAIKQQKKASAPPGIARLLASLGQFNELEDLFDECDESSEKWMVAATVYGHYCMTGDDDRSRHWADRLKQLWMTIMAERFSYRGLNKEDALEELFAQLILPSESAISKTISIFPKIEPSILIPALIKGFSNNPALAARVITSLELKPDKSEFSFDNFEQKLPKLAFTLLNTDEHESLAWQMFSILSSKSLEEGFLYLPAFLHRDPEKVLQTINFPPADYDDWDEIAHVLAFSRLTTCLEGNLIDAWIKRQPRQVQALISCCQAVISGDPEALDRAEKYFISQCAHFPIICNLASMAFLSLARQKQTSEDNFWQDILLDIFSELEESADVFRIIDDDTEDLEKQFKILAPRAGKIMQEIGYLFPDRKSAFWFAMAAASPALRMIINPEIQKWVHSKIEESSTREIPLELKPLSEAVKKGLPEYLQYNSDRDDIQKLILPVFFCFLDQDIFQDKVKTQAPIERPYSLIEVLPMINPDLDVSLLETLYPYLFSKDGDMIDFDDLLKSKIMCTAFQNPAMAHQLWKELVSVDGDEIKKKRIAMGLGPVSTGMETDRGEDEFGGENLDDDFPYFPDDDDDIGDGDLDDDLLDFPDDDDDIGDDNLDADLVSKLKNDKLDAEAVSIILLSSGLKKEAFEIAKSGKASKEYWDIFLNVCPELVSDLFDNLIEIVNNNYILGEKILERLLSTALDMVPEPEKAERLQQLRGYIESGLDDSDKQKFIVTVLRTIIRQDMGMEDTTYDSLISLYRDDFPDEEIARTVILWIETVARNNSEGAKRMLEEYAAFQAMQGLGFTANLQETFDRMISEYLENNAPGHAALVSCAKNLSFDFEMAREAITLVMLKTGCERKLIEPLLDFSSLHSLSSFARKLSGVVLPDWLRDRMFERLISLMNDREESFDPFLEDAFLAICTVPFWKENQRSHFWAILQDRINSAIGSLEDDIDHAKELQSLNEYQILLEALVSKDFTDFATVAAEDRSDLPRKLSYLASFNPKLSWQLFEQIPNPKIRSEYVNSIVSNAVKTDLLWMLETFQHHITPDNALDLIKDIILNSSPDQWALINNFVSKAVDHLPEEIDLCGTYYHEPLIRLIEQSPELAAKVFRRTQYRIGWIDFFFSSGEELPVDLFLTLAQLELPHWKQALIDLTPVLDQYNVNDFDPDDFISYLGKLPDTEAGRRIADELLDVLEEVITQVTRDRSDNIEGFIKELAPLFPKRALKCLNKFGYRGIYVDDIICDVLKADPGLFSQLYTDVFPALDSSDREKCVTLAITRMPLQEALEWQKREKVDLAKFCPEYIRNHPSDSTDMEKLLSLSGDKPSTQFVLYLEGILAAGDSYEETRKEWIQKAWDLFSRAKFTTDMFGDIEFEFPGHDPLDFDSVSSSEKQESLGILFACKPDAMENFLTRKLKDIVPEMQPKYEKFFDQIRENAIQPLFKLNPPWILRRLQDWSSRQWWREYSLADRLFETIIEIPVAEDAIHALAAFSFNEKGLRLVLDRVQESAEMQECLEVIISEMLFKNHIEMDTILKICLEYAPKANIEPMILLLDLAKQFENCRRQLGIQATNAEDLLERLQSIVKGTEMDKDRSEDVSEESMRETEKSRLMTTVSEEDRKRIENYDRLINELIQANMSQESIEILKKERDNILNKSTEQASRQFD